MEKRKARTGLVPLLLCGVLAYTLAAPGGSLEPSGPPQPTMRTLDEIYNAVYSTECGDSTDCGGLTYPEKLRTDYLYTDGHNYGPWMWIIGEQQGDILGESPVTSLDREESIDCYGFAHDVYVPYDPDTFQVSRPRKHTPISIIKRYDKASPLLYAALCTDELLTSVELRFYRNTPSGPEEHFFTVLLENGKIVDMRTVYPNLERVSFIYESITWRYVDGGIEYQDNVPGQ
ncbi:MAG: type VI secretion system tube protein TssD [Planctomycetota bacterium]|jgi:type VI secretion system secreted protein Hcp